jgi:hypothetical protein
MFITVANKNCDIPTFRRTRMMRVRAILGAGRGRTVVFSATSPRE